MLIKFAHSTYVISLVPERFRVLQKQWSWAFSPLSTSWSGNTLWDVLPWACSIWHDSFSFLYWPGSWDIETPQGLFCVEPFGVLARLTNTRLRCTALNINMENERFTLILCLSCYFMFIGVPVVKATGYVYRICHTTVLILKRKIRSSSGPNMNIKDKLSSNYCCRYHNNCPPFSLNFSILQHQRNDLRTLEPIAQI